MSTATGLFINTTMKTLRLNPVLGPCGGTFRLANSPVHAYLFHMRVEGDRHVQQDFALLHAANKVLDSVFELVGGLVDLFWVALPRLGQLLGRLEQLVCIGVSVLRGDKKEGRVKPGRLRI